eukprot:g71854.t1
MGLLPGYSLSFPVCASMAGADKQLRQLSTIYHLIPRRRSCLSFCLTTAFFGHNLGILNCIQKLTDMCAAKELRQLWTTYHTGVDFLAVYITEAHAKDEWPVGPTFSFAEQPKTQAARLALARLHQQRSQ